MTSLSTKEEFIVSVGFFCFVCGIIISLLLFIIKCIVFSKVNTVSISMIIFAISASIFYGLSSLFQGLYWLFIIGVINHVLLEHLCDLFQIFFWHLGQVMVYFYLLIRLYNGFKGTVYSIKWNISITLSILLCCYLIGCLIILSIIVWYIIWYLTIATNTDNGLDNLPYDEELQILFKSITLMVDFMLSLSLLVIFVYKLRKISESLNVMIHDEYDLISNDNSNINSLLIQDRETLQTQNENIYNVISKVLILGVIMIISSQISLILSLVDWIRNKDTNDTLTVVYSLFKGLHTLIASLSVFLGFEFTHNWYICCCGACHRHIKSCCLSTKKQ